jgi:hypothetical protein
MKRKNGGRQQHPAATQSHSSSIERGGRLMQYDGRNSSAPS